MFPAFYHSFHSYQAVFSSFSASSLSSSFFFFFFRDSLCCSNLAFYLASCFFFFYSFLASYFFFSWSGNYFINSFSLYVASLNDFSMASLSLTRSSPLCFRFFSFYSPSFSISLEELLRKSILCLMVYLSLTNFDCLLSSACKFGLFLSWCLSYYF